MKNTLGNAITLTLFGESHNEKIGAVLDGFTAGIKVDMDFIKECLDKRRPSGKGETKRIENDDFEIISGVFNGYTTGAPICIIISNSNIKSADYEKLACLARPSHADFVAHVKYHGYEDYRGGGHFSGRITAPIVALGSIAIKTLEKLGIKIGCHILKCGEVADSEFSLKNIDEEIDKVNSMLFPVINLNKEKEMQDLIAKVALDNDSIGGIIQTSIINLPVGLGEPWFSSVEGALSNALFGIGAIKGVSFGLGFDFANTRGSKANDEFYCYKGNVLTKTNNNGGINGGITNGMPVVFNCVVKPTPSIALSQDTINMETLENTKIEITGRHDPAIIRRINIVIRAVTALVICDMLAMKYGNDCFLKEKL